MIWLQIVYLVILVYLVIDQSKISNKGLFRGAWITFSAIPIINAFFTLFRAGSIQSARKLALVEVWSNGFAWLFLGISFLILINALIPAEEPKAFSLEISGDQENKQNQQVDPIVTTP
ncbi:hypothetical protein P4C99_22260, partial [Pontiellaceae bacterium B1224]|nr:hypothetical protein [Pontiellaceae bacterium B1224]